MLADGSKRSLATSMRMCNLKNATNDQCDSGRIDLEMFVASGTEELGMFDHLFKGDLVSLGYTTPSGLGEYARPKTGEVIYTQLLRIKRPVDVFSGYQLLAKSLRLLRSPEMGTIPCCANNYSTRTGWEAYSQNPKDDPCDGVDCGLEC